MDLSFEMNLFVIHQRPTYFSIDQPLTIIAFEFDLRFYFWPKEKTVGPDEGNTNSPAAISPFG